MKDLKKPAIAVALTAVGILAAGYIMQEFSDVDLIKKARNGFQGIA